MYLTITLTQAGGEHPRKEFSMSWIRKYEAMFDHVQTGSEEHFCNDTLLSRLLSRNNDTALAETQCMTSGVKSRKSFIARVLGKQIWFLKRYWIRFQSCFCLVLSYEHRYWCHMLTVQSVNVLLQIGCPIWTGLMANLEIRDSRFVSKSVGFSSTPQCTCCY